MENTPLQDPNVSFPWKRFIAAFFTAGVLMMICVLFLNYFTIFLSAKSSIYIQSSMSTAIVFSIFALLLGIFISIFFDNKKFLFSGTIIFIYSLLILIIGMYQAYNDVFSRQELLSMALMTSIMFFVATLFGVFVAFLLNKISTKIINYLLIFSLVVFVLFSGFGFYINKSYEDSLKNIPKETFNAEIYFKNTVGKSEAQNVISKYNGTILTPDWTNWRTDGPLNPIIANFPIGMRTEILKDNLETIVYPIKLLSGGEVTPPVRETPATTDAEKLNFKEGIEKAIVSGDTDIAAKARDAARIASVQKIVASLAMIMADGKPSQGTMCTENLDLTGYIMGQNPTDPSSSGPIVSPKDGLDCSKSYFYTNEVKATDDHKYAYGVYAKLELPNGNIHCSNIGTDKVITSATKDSGLYCYATLVE